jgi:hypothetical protein
VAPSEAGTRPKLMDSAIYGRGWAEDMPCRETTLEAIETVTGTGRRRTSGRADYTLRVRASNESEPVAVALPEAKKATLPPGHVSTRQTDIWRPPTATCGSFSHQRDICSSSSIKRRAVAAPHSPFGVPFTGRVSCTIRAGLRSPERAQRTDARKVHPESSAGRKAMD